MEYIWLNGALCSKQEAFLRVDDRGFLLGDGAFETIRVDERNGAQHIRFFEQHIARLFESLTYLGIPLMYESQHLLNACHTVLARYAETHIMAKVNTAASHTAAPPRSSTSLSASVPEEQVIALRITVSRGAGGRGLVPFTDDTSPTSSSTQNPTCLISLRSAHPAPVSLSAQAVPITRNEGAPSSRMKLLAYSDNIAARRLALQQGADEAIMPNNKGNIACAAAANIFVLHKGVYITPPPSEGALPGIIRARILLQASSLVQEAPLSTQALEQTEAAFITNSLLGAVPLRSINGRALAPPPQMEAVRSILQPA